MTPGASVDETDLAQFERLGAAWWDREGPMRALHAINPARVAWIAARINARLGRGARRRALLDIGCGGGLFSEAMARRGFAVTGLDPAPGNIEVARAHAREAGLAIDYRADTVEALAAGPARFDVVCALEVVEHVADLDGFMRAASALVAPGGLMVVSTLNRTLKSFALAILGAEYALRWLPRGTHRWEQFVTPGEIDDFFEENGLVLDARAGLAFHPLERAWRLTRDLGVNYMVSATRP